MKTKRKQDKNLFDFINDDTQIAEAHTTPTNIPQNNNRTIFKLNTIKPEKFIRKTKKRTIYTLNTIKKDTKVQELLQHIVNNEKSF